MAENGKEAGGDLKTKYNKIKAGKTVGTLSKVDAYGFERSDTFDYKAFEDFESEYLAVLARRTMRWDKIMKNGKRQKVKHDRIVKRFCRKGIPERYRTRAWMDVSGARKQMEKNPGIFKALLSTPSEDNAFEEELTRAIQTDLDRTFPDNVHFKNGSRNDRKKNLYNILVAYGRHCPSIGYCQGMNYIAALLLLVVNDEEKCYWLLCALIDKILPPYYTKSMKGLRAEMGVVTDLVRLKYPAVGQKMEVEKVSWMLIASKWFICLFVDVIPTETVLRVWDCLFFEGSKILLRVALCLIKEKQSEIISCNDMPQIIDLFKKVQSDTSVLECHQFMQKCFTEPNPLSRNEIEKLRIKNLKFVDEEDDAYKRVKEKRK